MRKVLSIVFLMLLFAFTGEAQTGEAGKPDAELNQILKQSREADQAESAVKYSLVEILFPFEDSLALLGLTPLDFEEVLEIWLPGIELPGGNQYLKDIFTRPPAQSGSNNNLYMVDLTGDEEPDLLLSGIAGAGEFSAVWVREAERFRFSFQYFGGIRLLGRNTPGAAYSIILEVPPSGVIQYGTFFRYAYDAGTFTVSDSYLYNKNMQKPQYPLPAFPFRVLQKEAPLRLAPAILDEGDEYWATDFEDIKIYGNILARYGWGAMGTALAYTETEAGFWLFVIMDKKNKSGYMRFHGDQKSHKTGWMYVENLEIRNDE